MPGAAVGLRQQKYTAGLSGCGRSSAHKINYLIWAKDKSLQMQNNTPRNVCPVEIAGALDNYLRRLIQNPRRILKKYLKTGDKILDLGCGPGFFTIDIAQLVGESGLVYAADIQEGMLDKVRKKISSYHLQNIKVHKCEESTINLNGTVDFILAFWMVHELADQDRTFSELKTMLNPNGKVLIIEPNFHVTKQDFQNMITRLEKAGFKIIEKPKLFFSRSVLLQIEK
jgi:2-polyprenyl-3-methyl-5-hydroxy-6-metoxy-1,4-benzoquinol methylase